MLNTLSTIPKSLLIFAIVIGLACWGAPVSDPDLGWQLLGGQWTASHKSVPQSDFINAFNTEWIDYHWLAQIILAGLYKTGGFPLLRLVFGISMALLHVSMLFSIYQASRGKIQPLLATLLLVAASLLTFYIFSIRPQIWALLIVSFVINLLLTLPSRLKDACILAAAIVTANMHVYWVLIPFMFACFRLLPALLLKRSNASVYDWIFFFCLACAGFVSPYSVKNYYVLWDYMQMADILKNRIGEMQGGLAKGGYLAILVLGYLVVLARIFSWKRFLATLPLGVLALLAPLLAYRSAKFISIFVLWVLPYLSKHGSRALRRLLPIVSERQKRLQLVLLVPLIVVAGLKAILGFPYIEKNKEEKILHSLYPIDICAEVARDAVKKPPAAHSIVIATHFDHGGWCRFAIDETQAKLDFRVTTDGRTQMVDPKLYEKSFVLYEGGGDWMSILAEWKPAYIIVRDNSALASLLSLTSEWMNLSSSHGFSAYKHKPS